MFSMISEKAKNITTKGWVTLSLWIATLVIMFVFIIYLATVNKDATIDPNIRANAVAIIGLLFTVSLFSSLIITVLIKYQESRGK